MATQETRPSRWSRNAGCAARFCASGPVRAQLCSSARNASYHPGAPGRRPARRGRPRRPCCRCRAPGRPSAHVPTCADDGSVRGTRRRAAMQRARTTGVPVGRAEWACGTCLACAGRRAAKRWCTPGLPRSHEPRRGGRALAVSTARRCITPTLPRTPDTPKPEHDRRQPHSTAARPATPRGAWRSRTGDRPRSHAAARPRATAYGPRRPSGARHRSARPRRPAVSTARHTPAATDARHRLPHTRLAHTVRTVAQAPTCARARNPCEPVTGGRTSSRRCGGTRCGAPACGGATRRRTPT